MKKPIAAAAIAATTLGGVAAGATVLGPGLAGAQDEVETPASEGFAERLSEALQPLVDDNTITGAQRDAVVEQLEASRAERGPGPRHGRGPHFGGEIAEILGMEPADIGAALRDGKSLADLADANGIDPQDLVDAIVASIEDRVDAGVESGRIDSTQAEEILADAAERAEDVVNGEIDGAGRGFGFGRRGPGGPGLPGSDTDASDPSA